MDLDKSNREVLKFSDRVAQQGSHPGESRVQRWCLIIIALSPSLVVGMLVTLVMPILPMIAQHFGGREGTLLAQYMASIAGGGALVGSILGGLGVDRFGYRRVLIFSLLVYIASGVLIPLFTETTAILICRFATGLGGGGFYAASTALIGQRWSGVSRAKLLGYTSTLGALFGILTMAASSLIAEAFGWRAAFFLHALALPLVVICFAAPTEKPTVASPATHSTFVDWNNLIPIYARALLLYIVLFIAYTQFPLALSEAGITNAKGLLLVVETPVACAAIAAFFFSYVYRRLGNRWMFLLILLFYGVGNAMMLTVTGTRTAMLPAILFGVNAGFITAYFTHEVLENAKEKIRGKASGVIVSVHYIAQFINPFIVGTMATVFGMRNALSIIGSILLVWFLVATLKMFRTAPLSKPAT